MARPRSIFERFSTTTLPDPARSEGTYVVQEGDALIALANRLYTLEEYDPDLWRDLAIKNSIANPFTFDLDLLGQRIRVPSPPLPQFL